MLENIKFNYKESLNPKSKPFTDNHKIFSCVISYNKKRYTVEFQCNPNYELPSKETVLNCLIGDLIIYEESVDALDFAKEMGYDDLHEAKRIFESIEKEAKALHRLFTESEIMELTEELDKNF